MTTSIFEKSRLSKCTGMILACMLLASCQFQPLYNSNSSAIGSQGYALSNISVSQVDTRVAQQVRNHLVFLLSGGSNPQDATHDVRLRVSSASADLAAKIALNGSNQLGNTAGQVRVTVSYEVFDNSKKEIVYRGTRTAAASFDKTSQSFAAQRAERDAENRAAKEAAEQLRLAISANFNQS